MTSRPEAAGPGAAARRGALLVAAAAVCWSSGGLLVRLVGTAPWTTSLWRSLFASLFLATVLWLVRGGLLLTSVLSALPAWQVVDPLPVLGTMKRARDDAGADDDAIEGLFQRARPPVQPRPATADPAPIDRARLAEEVTT